MAKNTTKKIKELKVEKPEKITESGSFESKKHNILHHISMLQEGLGKMQTEFEKTYGTADINIQDGTINHKKDEQTN